MADLRLRIIAALFMVFGGLWLHELIQARATSALIVDSALERAIAFMPWTIWIYVSFFVLIGWTVVSVGTALFWRFIVSASMAALIAWSIVLLLPISFERPDPGLLDSDFHRRVYTLIHEADPSHITFPSLHVAVTWICTFVLWDRARCHLRIALAVAISISTLTTKQHLMSDVIGGVALACFCVWITGKYNLVLGPWSLRTDRE